MSSSHKARVYLEFRYPASYIVPRNWNSVRAAEVEFLVPWSQNSIGPRSQKPSSCRGARILSCRGARIHRAAELEFHRAAELEFIVPRSQNSSCRGARIPSCRGARIPSCRGARINRAAELEFIVPRSQSIIVPRNQNPSCRGTRILHEKYVRKASSGMQNISDAFNTVYACVTSNSVHQSGSNRLQGQNATVCNHRDFYPC